MSSGLKAAIASGQIANLLKLTLTNGTIYGYTDHDMSITCDGQLYEPAAGLARVRMILTADAQVSNQEFAAAWLDVPEEDMIAGVYDDAIIEVSWVSWNDPTQGRVITFTGTLGLIQWTTAGFRADVQSHMRNLNKTVGTTFTASCRHSLFNQFETTKIGACTLNSATYTFNGTVDTIISPKSKITVTGLTQASGYFSNGLLTFVTGNNAGLSVEVKVHTNDTGVVTFELFLPTAFLINIGDTFSVQAGCDHTFTTCVNKFSNGINFGGFPSIKPEVNFQ
jgi:uncharacterized phage protein (TIGR02218 family)